MNAPIKCGPRVVVGNDGYEVGYMIGRRWHSVLTVHDCGDTREADQVRRNLAHCIADALNLANLQVVLDQRDAALAQGKGE